MSVASFFNIGELSSQRAGTSFRATLVAIEIVPSAACEGCRVGICAGRSKAGYLLNVGQTICKSDRSKEGDDEEKKRFSTVRGAHLLRFVIVGNNMFKKPHPPCR